MADPIKITVHPTLSNFRWLNFYALKKKIMSLMTILFILLLLFNYSDFQHDSDQIEYGSYFMKLLMDFLIILFCMLVVFIIQNIAIIRRWKKSSMIRENRTYIFSDAGIKITGESFNATFDWTHIKSVVFSKKRILLINTQNQYYPIPAESLTDVKIAESFKSLLESKIENIKGV